MNTRPCFYPSIDRLSGASIDRCVRLLLARFSPAGTASRERHPHSMRSVVSGLLVCLMCALALPVAAQDSFVNLHGSLRVDGNRIVNAHGMPVTLRGMSLYCWSESGTRFYNASAVDWLISDWMCTLIRIPILPSAYMNNPGWEISKVRTVIDACIARGVYVIVDWHSMDGAQHNLWAANNFFTEVATLYGATPNLIYETWNEPINESWKEQIKPYHEAVIKTIRAIDPDNIILCGTRRWAQEVDEASLDPITTFDNIAYTLHFYSATHKEELRTKARTALDNGVALFASEWGASEASGDGTFDSTQTRLWLEFLDANGISQANWSVAALGETSAALQPWADASGRWDEHALKQSGKFVRAYLRDANSAASPVIPRRTGSLVSMHGPVFQDYTFDLRGRLVAGPARASSTGTAPVFATRAGGVHLTIRKDGSITRSLTQ